MMEFFRMYYLGCAMMIASQRAMLTATLFAMEPVKRERPRHLKLVK